MRICKWCGHGHSFHKPLNLQDSDLEVCDGKGQVVAIYDKHNFASWRSGKDVEVCQCSYGFADMPDIAELWQSIDLCNETIKDGKKLGVDVSQLKQVVSELMKAIKIIDKEREENI